MIQNSIRKGIKLAYITLKGHSSYGECGFLGRAVEERRVLDSSFRPISEATMELTAAHQDALTELINIGYGRAAASLSQLTRRRIALEVPRIGVYEIDKAVEALRQIMHGE